MARSTVSATGTDPDGDALTYAWDLDGNGTFETPGASFVFSAAGIQAPATRTFSVQVTDPDGATGTDTATVSVVWAFDGFGPPLSSSGGINAANAGSTIPVKFSLGGNQGLAIFKAGYPASASYDCGSTPPTECERSRGLERVPQLRQGGGPVHLRLEDRQVVGGHVSRARPRCSGTARSTPSTFQFSKATEVPVKKGSEAPGRTK